MCEELFSQKQVFLTSEVIWEHALKINYKFEKLPYWGRV